MQRGRALTGMRKWQGNLGLTSGTSRALELRRIQGVRRADVVPWNCDLDNRNPNSRRR